MKIAGTLRRLEREAIKAGVFTCRHCRGCPQVVVQEWLQPNPDGPGLVHIREPLSEADKEAFVGWLEDGNWSVEDLRCRWCGQKAEPLILVRPGRSAEYHPELAPSAVTDRAVGNTNAAPIVTQVNSFERSFP